MDIDSAIAVLTDALERCSKEDVGTPEMFAALDTENDEGRWQLMNASLNAVKLALSRGIRY